MRALTGIFAIFVDMTELHEILHKYWGYDQFRPLQEEIIRSVLDGNDTLALLPTGGGKSICFQVPALAREGICIVVSPLIALMKDQVNNLKKKSIPAIAIVSGMHPREVDIALDNCIHGPIKFLYLSPERLTSDMVRERIRQMKVNLLAIDEAHCISQWGYDFRPPYLRIAEIRELLPEVPVMALTATATGKVAQDIQEKLGFRQENVLQKSFERKNLAYLALKEEDKMGRLLRIFNKIPGSGLVYVRSRKRTREIAEFLDRNGIKSDYYHAGLPSPVRDQKQKNWVENRCRIIVATNAFGMGIDKPDVRCVVHVDLPDTLEGYFQEAGRAGRDGEKAYAALLFETEDIKELERRTEQSFPEIQTIKRVYQALANFYQLAIGSSKGQAYNFDLSEFCQRYQMRPIQVFNSLSFLEKEGYLSVTDALYLPSRIYIPINKDELYKFQVANRNLDNFIKLILRSYSGMFEDYVKINETDLARRANIGRQKVIDALKYLDKLGVVSYLPKTTLPQVIFLEERLDLESLIISKEHHLERKNAALERMNSVINYVSSKGRCRSRILLEYFGESDTHDCGQCDQCLENNKGKSGTQDRDRIAKLIREQLKSGSMGIDALVKSIPGFPEKKTIEIIRWLIDSQRVRMDSENKLSWIAQSD